MQTLNTIKLQDLLIFEGDMDNIISVVDVLPTGTVETAGERYFLKTAYKCPVIVSTSAGQVIDHYEYLNPGKIYKCTSYVYTDVESGEKSTQYKWKNITFAENGALAACQLTTPIVKEVNPSSAGGGTNVRIMWTDPVDKANSTDPEGNPDPSLNAIWAYTVIVRKQGSVAPKTVFDGEIVGYSSIRNQYNNSVGFIDLEPDGVSYTYNLFAVTRYGVATGLEGSQQEEIDWAGIQTAIRAGKAGSIFGIGDVITVEHNIFGPLYMQVVGIDNATIDTSVSGQSTLTHSVTFMSQRVIMQATYDAPEHAIVDSDVNPGDVQKDENYNVSTNGRATWKYCNLRQWLNALSTYSETGDTKYDTTKCYFEYSVATGKYTLVDIPDDPSTVNPHANGWYEAGWQYVTPGENKWDKQPNLYQASPDADYVKDASAGVWDIRKLPGFLSGFTPTVGTKKGVVDAMLYVNNTTVNDQFIYDPRTSPKETVTSDRVFIPSYRELMGSEPLGVESKTGEGKLFPFFDKTKTIPGLTDKDRSLLKYDLNGRLAGYYTRTIGTDSNHLGIWSQIAPSRIWSVNVLDYTEPPPLTKSVTKVCRCAMAAEEVGAQRSSDPTSPLTSPGIVFCFVIG